jgi:F-type H+-transporting ATPase subunit b
MQLPDLSLLLVMAIFWATHFVLKIFVFRPLGAILQEREARITSAEAALEKTLLKEKEVLAELDLRLTSARREALAAREAARVVASAKRQQALDQAREKARRAVQAAQERLEGEIVKTREDLRLGAGDTAREIASQTLGRMVA